MSEIKQMLLDIVEWSGSQEAAARTLDCSLRTMSRWLNDKASPTLAWKKLIAECHKKLKRKEVQ